MNRLFNGQNSQDEQHKNNNTHENDQIDTQLIKLQENNIEQTSEIKAAALHKIDQNHAQKHNLNKDSKAQHHEDSKNKIQGNKQVHNQNKVKDKEHDRHKSNRSAECLNTHSKLVKVTAKLGQNQVIKWYKDAPLLLGLMLISTIPAFIKSFQLTGTILALKFLRTTVAAVMAMQILTLELVVNSRKVQKVAYGSLVVLEFVYLALILAISIVTLTIGSSSSGSSLSKLGFT